jgi:hypothetical protein
MDARLLITFGMVAVFFAAVISILYVAHIKDTSFTDYAVGGRSFNGFYVAMSFLNTWWPGTTFIAFAGLSAASGVIGFYALLYSLLTVMLMYLMARRVWIWGARFNLRTQSDLLALRFNSKHIRTIATVISVISLFPWIVLGMQALGLVFRYLSLNHLSVIAAMLLGVALMAIRQIWTIQMGMRECVMDASEKDEWLREHPPDVSFFGFHAEPAIYDTGSEIAQVVAANNECVTGRSTQARPFTATIDNRFFQLYFDIPTTCYGPTGERLHAPDEWVDLESVRICTQSLAGVLIDWCGLA